MQDASKVDTNLFALFDFAAEAVGKPRRRQDGYSYVDLRPSPWGKAVYDLDFAADRLPSSLVDGIVAQRIPNRVRVGPTSRPLEVEGLLRGGGLVPERMSRAMGLELARRLAPARESPVAFDAAMVVSEEDTLSFSRIVVQNLFGERVETSVAFAGLIAQLDPTRAFGYVGRAGGEPVSAAYAFIDDEGIGGAYFVATEAAARGKGYGASTVAALLDELGRRGVEYCILQATELGKPVYESLGFVDLGPLPIYSLPGS